MTSKSPKMSSIEDILYRDTNKSCPCHKCKWKEKDHKVLSFLLCFVIWNRQRHAWNCPGVKIRQWKEKSNRCVFENCVVWHTLPAEKCAPHRSTWLTHVHKMPERAWHFLGHVIDDMGCSCKPAAAVIHPSSLFWWLMHMHGAADHRFACSEIVVCWSEVWHQAMLANCIFVPACSFNDFLLPVLAPIR